MTFQTLKRVADDLRVALADLEPERLSGPDAARMLDGFAEIEKLASGGKLLSARRVESSNVWRRRGHRSAAAHVAEATGTGLGPAINALKAARRLDSLPATDDAMRHGRLSEVQVTEITGAAILQPDAEEELVETARQQPLTLLKLRCRRVKAVGSDQKATYEAIHRRRSLRNWIDDDGAVRFDATLTPDDGARLIAAVRAESDRLVVEARRAGLDEPVRALAADALVRVACGNGPAGSPVVRAAGGVGGTNGSGRDPNPSGRRRAPTGPRGGRATDGPGCSVPEPSATVHVRVDHQALVRGHLRRGEICEIPGIGPIPVEVARRLAVDSILHVLVTDGVDVTAVAHAGRTIPAPLKRALIERDPVCVVSGCGTGDGLEIDHVEPFGQGGATSLDNLARLCHWHHYLKTHHGHRLERVEGGWRWDSPDDWQQKAAALHRSG
jgi:Domain of unknown function (DUF222)